MWVGVRVQCAALPGRVDSSVQSRAMAVQVCAHITGTVWKIEVAVGDAVEAEQSLVILESMKMEMPVEAPEAGRVTRIAVSEGQAVEEGDVLVELG
jgi:acetyl-CoA carboxylase biotin carboxyl carrier protein